MKEKYSNYIAIGLTAFLVIAASILLFFVLHSFPTIKRTVGGFIQILEPFIVGTVIAYLLAPLYNRLVRNLEAFFTRKLSAKRGHALAVALALTGAILAAVAVTVGTVALVVPRFISSIVGIVGSLETYSNNIMHWLSNLLSGYPDMAAQVEDVYQNASSYFLNWVNTKLTPNVEALWQSISSLSTIFSGVVSGVRVVVRIGKDYILGMFVAAYLLVSKKRLIAQAKKILYAIARLPIANYVLSECRFIQNVFGGFIRGKLLDSLIIGIICFVCCSLFRFPYPIVVSVIVGVTNIIPFFGPFVGAIPSALLILLTSPIKCLYFVIFIIALQQFDGNFLGPKILGSSTGLSSFWVLFSIILFGGMFGFVGMVIAVPLFAVIYSLIDVLVKYLLKKKSMSVNTEDYELLDHIDENSRDFIHMKDPTIK